MAASDPATDVPTPTGTLQGVATFSWDGSAWQPAGRAGPSVATPTGVLRGVAPFSSDGVSWQPLGRAQPGVATPSGVLDGVAVYTWSGSAWTPPGGQPTPSTPSGALRGVAAFNWDGIAWQPAGQAGPSVATPYGVLDGVAMFNWTGSAWAAVQGPSLDISFMTPGDLDARITFTRASTATYFDQNGVLQTAAVNAPRWDYNPTTHVLNGLLIEDTRTNLLLNSATLGTQSVAVTAQAYTLSFYGTGTITMSGAFAGTLVGSGAFPARAQTTFTPAAGTLTCTVSGSVLSAQLEAGATLATSYIPTTAAAGTRAQDTCYITPITPWYSANAFSVMGEILNVQGTGGFLGFSDGTFGNSLYAGASGGAVANVGVSFIPTSASSPTVAMTRAAITKLAYTFSPAALGMAGNGVYGGAAAMSTSPFTAPTRFVFGNDPWSMGSAFDGYIRRMRYWPRVLSNAEMQAVTT
jgi:hypothetical protein